MGLWGLSSFRHTGCGCRMITSTVVLFTQVSVCGDTAFIQVPEWETDLGFDPYSALADVRQSPSWVTLEGDSPIRPAAHVTTEDALRDNCKFDASTLPLRDPSSFVSGQVHENESEWQYILSRSSASNIATVSGWIHNGADANDFFIPFRGNFKGGITILIYHIDSITQMPQFADLFLTLL